MLFLNQNYILTTTMITISAGAGGTITAENLFDNRKSTQFGSQGNNDDLTSTTITIELGETLTVSNVILLNHNLKDFSCTYDTAGTAFNPPISETTNSQTSNYYSVATVATTRINLIANKTNPANQEKKIGEFIISKLLYDFTSDRLPPAKAYKPDIFRKQVVHKMSDGGITLYNISEKFKAQFGFTFLPISSATILKSIYNSKEPFYFAPWETTTAWDGDIFECNWMGGYGLMEWSDNNIRNGYKGKITIQETSGR